MIAMTPLFQFPLSSEACHLTSGLSRSNTAVKTDVPKLQQLCTSCHTQYRERLDDGTYRFKPPAR